MISILIISILLMEIFYYKPLMKKQTTEETFEKMYLLSRDVYEIEQRFLSINKELDLQYNSFEKIKIEENQNK